MVYMGDRASPYDEGLIEGCVLGVFLELGPFLLHVLLLFASLFFLSLLFKEKARFLLGSLWIILNEHLRLLYILAGELLSASTHSIRLQGAHYEHSFLRLRLGWRLRCLLLSIRQRLTFFLRNIFIF
jgi:hypothetical protein